MNPVRRALISVHDKTGVVDFARGLADLGVEILSTGGTAKLLRESGVPVVDVAQVTGFPEMLDGRVKTLHPKVHGGILARRDRPEHMVALEAHGIGRIDLVAVTLYPFEATVAAPGVTLDEAVENIDIGGPSMIRGAAKNHASVAVITDTGQYAPVLEELRAHQGGLSPETRYRLAFEAFRRTAQYDAAIAAYLREPGATGRRAEGAGAAEGRFPQRLHLEGSLVQGLRYGENPHQGAAFYRLADHGFGLSAAAQHHGPELGYNNLLDWSAALGLLLEFDEPAAVVIKHTNPCGTALGATVGEAIARAKACDPVSIYGGIVAVNTTLDAKTAEDLAKRFLEVVIAPDATEEALAVLARRQNVRVLLAGTLPDPSSAGMTLKSVGGGYLLQTRDIGHVKKSDLKVVTKRAPTPKEIEDMLFAFTVCKHVKSNAIVYAKDGATVGVGAGQMNRRDSSRIAAIRAAEAGVLAGLKESPAVGSVVASDAFFPFADGLLAAAEAGATAVIQPGGSLRDKEVIEAADGKGLAMVFTGMRHFRH